MCHCWSMPSAVHENLRTALHHKANRCSRHHGWRGRQQRCSLLCQELCPFHLCGEVTWTKPQLEVGNGWNRHHVSPCVIPNLLRVVTFLSNLIAPCRQPHVLSATQVHVDRNLAKSKVMLQWVPPRHTRFHKPQMNEVDHLKNHPTGASAPLALRKRPETLSATLQRFAADVPHQRLKRRMTRELIQNTSATGTEMDWTDGDSKRWREKT